MTEEQRAIIRRIRELSASFDQAAAAHQSTQALAGRAVIDIAADIALAIHQTGTIVTLGKQYGDALRELLDTL